jgi:hypothetical protein
MNIKFFLADLKKYSNTRFYDNPSSGSRGDPCGQTDRQADMAELTFPFRNFANALKKLRNDRRVLV